MDNKFRLEDLPGYPENNLDFQRDEVIIHEGEPSDGSLYLLNSGSVGVYRTVDETEVFIERIDAFNFFGEIEVYTGGSRLATVKALTDDVSATRLLVSDLGKTILPNSMGELLAQRLSMDLKDYCNRYIKSEACINRLLDEKDKTGESFVLLLIAINKVLESISQSAWLSDNEVLYVIALKELIRKYVAVELPEINYRLENTDKIDFRPLYEENLIPEKLSGILISSF